MADGRMLKKAVSHSRRLADLKNDSHRLLYTWIIPHLDVEGRFHADPLIIKGSIVPRLKHITETIITEALVDMVNNDLICLYQIDGERYLELRKFEDHQTHLRKDREAPSKIPPLTQENLIRIESGPDPDLIGVTEVKLREVKLIALSKDSAGKNPPVPFKKLPKIGSKHFKTKLPNIHQVEKLCLKIKKIGNGKFNAYQFVQKCTNDNQHPQAIFDALAGMIKMWPDIKNHWTYATAIIKTKSQNYHESEHMKQAEAFKIDWAKEFFE